MATTVCKKCGCEDQFLTTPAAYPTPQGCPEPEPCSEVFDAQCVQYTGPSIVCDEETIIPTNTDLATALNSLTELACAQPVRNGYIEIAKGQGLTAVANLYNITGPVTYQWSFASNSDDFNFSGSTTTSTVTLAPQPINGYFRILADTVGTPASSAHRLITLLKVKVTDSLGNVYTETYLFQETITSYF